MQKEGFCFVLFLIFLFIYVFIWLLWVLAVACGIFSCSIWNLVPWPGIESQPPASGAQSLNCWTTWEVLEKLFKVVCIWIKLCREQHIEKTHLAQAWQIKDSWGWTWAEYGVEGVHQTKRREIWAKASDSVWVWRENAPLRLEDKQQLQTGAGPPRQEQGKSGCHPGPAGQGHTWTTHIAWISWLSGAGARPRNLCQSLGDSSKLGSMGNTCVSDGDPGKRWSRDLIDYRLQTGPLTESWHHSLPSGGCCLLAKSCPTLLWPGGQ